MRLILQTLHKQSFLHALATDFGYIEQPSLPIPIQKG
jgi:hypothetical protein